MSKIDGEPTVYAVHIKPFFRTAVVDEIASLGHPRIKVATIDQDYTW